MEQRAQLILFWMARLEGMDARNEVAEIVDKHRQVYIRGTHSTMGLALLPLYLAKQ